jgi:hypothetical protein
MKKLNSKLYFSIDRNQAENLELTFWLIALVGAMASPAVGIAMMITLTFFLDRTYQQIKRSQIEQVIKEYQK